jgi:hypothetical protein
MSQLFQLYFHPMTFSFSIAAIKCFCLRLFLSSNDNFFQYQFHLTLQSSNVAVIKCHCLLTLLSSIVVVIKCQTHIMIISSSVTVTQIVFSSNSASLSSIVFFFACFLSSNDNYFRYQFHLTLQSSNLAVIK